jgi:hypothetical protein
MNKPVIIDENLIRAWMQAKLEPATVEEQMKMKDFDEESIAAYVKEYKRLLFSKRRFNGFLCAGLGAILGFISCLLTIINPVPELYNLILFGLTSVAILLICVGLYFLFE